MDTERVWDILVDWSLLKGDKSFPKTVNKKSLHKTLRDYVKFTFSDLERFTKFLKYFSLNSPCYYRLQRIDIQHVNNYSRARECEGFAWIAQILALPNLKTLCINDIDWIHEALFQKIDSPVSLQAVTLRNVPLTGKTIENLLGFTPFLVDLRLEKIRMVNDSLLEFFPLYLQDLEILSLEGCSISNLGIFHLFSQSDTESEIQFEGNDIGKDMKGSKYFLSRTNLQRLVFLNISECFQIDDFGIQEIAQKVHGLKGLEIRGLNRITLSGLNSSLKCLTELKKLDLRGILSLRGTLNGDGLEELKISIQVLEILQDLKDLRKLEIYISGTDTGRFGDILGRIITRNQKLQELVLVKDNSLGMYSLEDLDLDFEPSKFPHLKITLVTDESSRFT